MSIAAGIPFEEAADYSWDRLKVIEAAAMRVQSRKILEAAHGNMASTTVAMNGKKAAGPWEKWQKRLLSIINGKAR